MSSRFMSFGALSLLATTGLGAVRADYTVDFAGTVLNRSGLPVAGATVTVWQTSLSTTTDESGAFDFSGARVAATPRLGPSSSPLSFGLKGDHLLIANPGAGTMCVSLYNVQGRLIRTTASAGRLVRVPLRKADGMFAVRQRAGAASREMMLTVVDGRVVEGTHGTIRTDRLSDRSSSTTALCAARTDVAGDGDELPPLLFYLRARKSGCFDGYAVSRGNTARDLTITLVDSSAFSALDPYRNPALPLDQRVEDLVSRMSKSEQVSLLSTETPRIERLGIPEANWWQECLCGPRRKIATVTPTSLHLAATWDESIVKRAIAATSGEIRSLANDHYFGSNKEILGSHSCFSPLLDMIRDPRYGRSYETFSEDPYLTARIGVSFVKGLQGEHPFYLRVIATPKHFAAYSGPETSFDAAVSQRDFRDYFLPAYKTCFQEGKAQGTMCSRFVTINGKSSCKNSELLNGILREEWGFEGHVTSDKPADVSLAAGCDLPLRQGYTTDEDDAVVKRAAKRVVRAFFKLGIFDPPEMVPYMRIPRENILHSPENFEVARRAAREGIVLLKNENNTLPLSKDLGSIAVVGPQADEEGSLYDGVEYAGYSARSPDEHVTVLQGIRNKLGDGTEIKYSEGGSEAVAMADQSHVAVAVLGLRSGERQDRRLTLPDDQQALLEQLHNTGTPVVLVLMVDGALFVNWADDNVPAIVSAFLPGMKGGDAIADVLFGDYNPAGRLPVTFYKNEDQLPDFKDYDISNGRTYLYLEQEPLYPFGFGLSYSTFSYANLRLSTTSPGTDETVRVTVDVENTGERGGDEVVQLYVRDEESLVAVPIRKLAGFRRVYLAPGETKTVSFAITPYQLTVVREDGGRYIEPGAFTVYVGGGQPVARTPSNVLEASFTVTGQEKQITHGHL